MSICGLSSTITFHNENVLNGKKLANVKCNCRNESVCCPLTRRYQSP